MCLGSSLLQAADHVQGSEYLFAGLTRKVLIAVAMCYCCALVDFTTVFFANAYWICFLQSDKNFRNKYRASVLFRQFWKLHFHILIASSFFLFFILFSLFFPFFFFLFEFVWKFLFTRVSNTSMNLRPCMGLAIMLLSHTNFVKDKALQYVLHHCA